MTKYVESKNQQNLIYDLFAVTNHFGSLNCGHYTAYAKNHINEKWIEYNDSMVGELMSDKSVVT